MLGTSNTTINKMPWDFHFKGVEWTDVSRQFCHNVLRPGMERCADFGKNREEPRSEGLNLPGRVRSVYLETAHPGKTWSLTRTLPGDMDVSWLLGKRKRAQEESWSAWRRQMTPHGWGGASVQQMGASWDRAGWKVAPCQGQILEGWFLSYSLGYVALLKSAGKGVIWQDNRKRCDQVVCKRWYGNHIDSSCLVGFKSQPSRPPF